jgi:microsomal epoxide hydrolase
LRSVQLTTGDGVRLNVLEAGPLPPDPSLPVIVLVPGWCMPATIWQAQLQALGQRFRTLAPDPRGQGDSDIPAAGYEAERRASDLRDVLAPLPRVVLVGWSLGVLDALTTVDRFVRGMFAHPRPEAEIERIKQAALKMPLDGAIALLSYPFPREHWRNIARSFAKPLCYCVTSRYLEQARNLQRERPATRVEWFEHAGHALFVDEPERFNRVISDFAQSA